MKEFNELHLPASVRYAKSHEWLAVSKPYRIGISDFAQDRLGDITYAELPLVGADYARGSEFGSLESIKSVSSVYMPVDGKVIAVNNRLQDEPGLVNSDPYGDGWLIEIEPLDPAAIGDMLSAEDYGRMVKEEE